MIDIGKLFADDRPQGLHRHWASHFTRKVTAWIAGGFQIDGRHLIVDNIEESGSPFVEEIHIGFRMLREVPANHQAVWGRLPDPVARAERGRENNWQSEPRYYYTLSAEISFDENVANLKAYVVSQREQAQRPPGPA